MKSIFIIRFVRWERIYVVRLYLLNKFAYIIVVHAAQIDKSLLLHVRNLFLNGGDAGFAAELLP